MSDLHTIRRALARPATAYRWATGPVRALPDFIVIGGQKCGTTSLFNWLTTHPNVLGATRKEPDWFSDEFDRDENWYRRYFPTPWGRQATRLRARGPVLVGEASTSYLPHPHAPRRVRELLPSARLVVLLRNPVARAVSHYQHSFRKGYETLPLAEALACEDERLAGELERLEADPTAVSWPYRRNSYIHRGEYDRQLERWFAQFPRDQILIARSEDLFADPDPVLRSVVEFLGLPDRDVGDFPRSNRGEYPADLDPEVRELLAERLAPSVARLEALLDRRFDWDLSGDRDTAP